MNMVADVSNWPTVDFKGRLYDLPLPAPGKSGCRTCQLGSRNECEHCEARREASDRKLVAAMKAQRNSAVSRQRPKVEEPWE